MSFCQPMNNLMGLRTFSAGKAFRPSCLLFQVRREELADAQ